MNPTLNSSERMDWQTPPAFLDLVRDVAPIRLDPCTVESNPTDAEEFFDYPRLNGLDYLWSALGGLVFCNPPYGRELPVWVDRCLVEARLGASIILLVPARTDTKWFRRAYEAAEAVCLWSGRIKFLNADPAAPSPEVMWDKKKSDWVPVCGAAFPSAVFLFGDRHSRAFRQVFSPKGIMVTP